VSSQRTMTYAWVVARTRSRNACKTRADLLSAARRRFGTEGYDRTTIRAIAADVGVDAALVLRYFGSKQELFAAAADLNLDLPDLTALAPGRLAGALLARFFAVWEDDETFLALLRASMTSESVAETLRQVFAAQVEPTLSAVVPDHPRERAGLVGAFIIGLATTRYALAAPGLAAMDRDQITAWATPVVDQLLTGPAPPVPDSAAVRQLPRRRPSVSGPLCSRPCLGQRRRIARQARCRGPWPMPGALALGGPGPRRISSARGPGPRPAASAR
jgi:AcrR family transcriptional regulator